MASQRQIEANRRNGARGGPKTERGKAHCRMNALVHGLCAQTPVLPGENAAGFQDLRAGLLDHWKPEGAQEQFEFEQLANSAWRLLRVRSVETAMWSHYIKRLRENEGKPEPPTTVEDTHVALAGVLCTVEDRNLNNYFRYDRSIERAYYRAIQQLERTQSLRRRAAAAKPVAPPKPAPPSKPLSDSGIRSVSLAPSPPSKQPPKTPPRPRQLDPAA